MHCIYTVTSLSDHLIQIPLPKERDLDACSASTELLETPEVIAKNRRERVQLWQVVVHNDPVNLMSYVTMVFCKIFGFNKQISEKHMLEVHHHGRSILWVGDREQAELYVQKLHAELLLATLEPAL